jgi:hypothetical protein
MNCWHCKEQLIWGGDEMIDDDDWRQPHDNQPILSQVSGFRGSLLAIG